MLNYSPPNIKYDFQNNNYNTSPLKYAGNIGGEKIKTNQNSSQRKIREGRQSKDRGEYSQYSVPSSYVPATKLKSFKTSKQSPVFSVSRLYLRENERTISAPKKSKVPQSYLHEADSNKKSIPVPYNNTTIHEINTPITIEHSSTQNIYFSLFHTVSYRTIPVEII